MSKKKATTEQKGNDPVAGGDEIANDGGRSERRREARIPAPATTFDLDVPGSSPVRCQVSNLSRLGFGMEILPSALTGPYVEGLANGAVVSGHLSVAGARLPAKAEIRMRRARFFGLEYVDLAADFLTRLRGLLTPQYVASSMHAIAPEFLGPDIRAAYRADDFECIIFEPGVSGVKSMVQIFFQGTVVEVVDDRARFVPAPLVRSGARSDVGELLRSFEGLNDDGTDEELRGFFQALARVFQCWTTCPLELQSMLKRQLATRG